jgi:serine phosphatase RsbU (regulator of sigma subunit)
MIQTLVLVETVALAALVWWVMRRAPTRAVTGGRLAGIAALVAAQAVLLDAFALGIFPTLWGGGEGGLPGLLTLVQAGRAGLLIAGAALWYGISRDDLAGNGRGAFLMVALLVVALTAGSIPVLGVAALVWLTGRPRWTNDFAGWRRLIALILCPLLLALTTFWPRVHVDAAGLTHQWVFVPDPWQTPLVSGAVPRSLEAELMFARPFDRVVQALVDLFRAQLIVLTVRALTMPMRLYGMSLRRRFMVNHLFVRSVPSVLATLTLVVVGYFALGVHKAGQARDGFERTLARADAAGLALLDDPRLRRGGPEAVAVLDGAREWLGADGARAHLALRHRGESPEGDRWLATTADIPARLLSEPWPASPSGNRRGVLETDSALYLFSRRTDAPDSSRTLAVFIRVDSAGLADLARSIHAGVSLWVERGGSQGLSPIRLTAMPRASSKAAGSSGGPDPRPERRLFLARTDLPLGEWNRAPGGGGQAGRWRERDGALVLEFHATPALLVRTLVDVPRWFFSNVVMVVVLLVLTGLFGIIESLAVRSGRGIVRSIEEEVGSLREAATRFGAGELGHRIPVRGRDELSALAGSFNEMAASLERQRAELVEKERMDEDLEVALAIQRRFLPQRAPSVPGLEVAGISVPSREVGGDLFHYLELAGGRLAVALGDVSGKSVPAALIMSNVMSALRAEVQHEAEVERSLERINRLLVEQIEPGRFVTLFYGIADPTASRLRYTNAGHNPALRLSAAGEVSWLREGGVPLGVEPSSRYPSAEIPLDRGDVLVAYSDGVTEAEGPEREGRIPHFGEERLAETIVRLRAEPAEAIIAGVLAAVKAFAAGRPQADDITLVVLKRG